MKRRRARREVTVSGLGKGEKVVRRGAEVGRDARCCVKVAISRLLEEQIAAVVVVGRGEKNDGMCHIVFGCEVDGKQLPAEYGPF